MDSFHWTSHKFNRSRPYGKNVGPGYTTGLERYEIARLKVILGLG